MYVLGSSIHWIIQERILEWVVMPSLRGIFPTQGLNPCLLYLLHWQTRATWETSCLHLFPLPRLPSFDISIFHPLDTFIVWNVRTLELGYLGPNSGFVGMSHDNTYSHNTLCFVFNISETKMDIVTVSGVALRIKCVCVCKLCKYKGSTLCKRSRIMSILS